MPEASRPLGDLDVATLCEQGVAAIRASGRIRSRTARIRANAVTLRHRSREPFGTRLQVSDRR
jgi:hypothetical protein